MNPMSRNLKVALLFLTLLVIVRPGAFWGQAIDGNIVGTIVDSQGAAVVGAEVTATNVATGVVASTKSGNTGDYRFDHLLVGTYRINVKMTGFKSASENVSVDLNMTGTKNIMLTPGATTETVEVSGVPPIIDTTTSQLQTTYQNDLLQALPTAMSGGALGGGVLNASLLQAGVASTGGLGAGSGPSIGGQRARNNNFTIEGSDNNSKGVTGPLVYIPNDAVANFTVITNQFSPEFGHSTGGQFNQVVMNGGNSIHGMAYEYFRNRNLNAIDYATARQFPEGEKPENSRYDNNRFGGQVGGPIIKNKLFYFANFEYNPVGQASSPGSAVFAPTADGWNAISEIPGVSANNIAGFSQYATAPTNDQGTVVVNDYVTTPGTPIAHNIPVGTVPIIAPNYINGKFLTTSGDWNISDTDQLHMRYIYNRYSQIDSGATLPVFYTSLLVPFHLVTVGESHTFSSNIVNEFRVGYTRTSNNYTVPNFTFPGLDAFPNLTIDDLNGMNVGPAPNNPQYATENTYQMQDNLSWNVGKHSLKFGIDLRKQIAPQLFIQRSRGDYEWSTLDGFVNDLMPDFGQRSFGSVGYSGDDKMIGWYVNDIWKITPHLSLNLGLRYEYLSVPAGWKQQTLNAIADAPDLIPGVCCTFSTEPHASKKNFMPRIGFAYSPGSSGNTSIRGGFAMAYDVLFDNIGTLSRPPQIGSTVNCPDTGGLCHATGFLANGGIPPQTSSGITDLTREEAQAATSSYLMPDVKYPYAESWNLGVQHAFGPYTAEVRYVGTRGIHLDTQNILNFATYVTPTNSLPTYLQEPSQAELDALTVTLDGPGGLLDQSYYCVTTCYNTTYNAGFLSPITAFAPWGWSTYHGLQTQMQRKFSNGLQFLAAYTWSHEIDNSTADFFSTVISPRRPQDFHNLGAEKANGLIDHRHRLSIQVNYEVPWFKNDSSWVKKNLLGNYQFIPVYTWESGQWGTVQSGQDANLNADSAPDRAIFNPQGQKGVGSDVTALTNTAGYTVAYLANNPDAQYIRARFGAYANSSRGAFSTPPINNFDISAIKHFKIGERYGVQFIAQSFNLFNHPQFVPGSINDVLSFSNTGSRNYFLPANADFGNASKNFRSNARSMQLALKFTF